ncbi:lysophospholipid acyltransferase family protein [Stappia sp.]|uniref:lysophospholipid acyltransferase family protein n=1 Tax=Stappia sp. TaxID=1870903 RepID=UPI003A99C70B
MLKRAGRHPLVQGILGNGLAAYLQGVRKTSRFVLDPPDLYDRFEAEIPAIIAMWHGQHFLLPVGRPPHFDIRVMISRSADGEINAIAARKLGMGLVRGSGGQTARQIAKRGGVRGFIELMRALKQGASIALTADVPKVGGVVGSGIVKLASHSGRPIVPLAMASSRHIHLRTWDKATINLPFSTIVLSMGKIIHVAPGADDAAIERARGEVKASLEAVTQRAYAIAAGKIPAGSPA